MPHSENTYLLLTRLPVAVTSEWYIWFSCILTPLENTPGTYDGPFNGGGGRALWAGRKTLRTKDSRATSAAPRINCPVRLTTLPGRWLSTHASPRVPLVLYNTHARVPRPRSGTVAPINFSIRRVARYRPIGISVPTRRRVVTRSTTARRWVSANERRQRRPPPPARRGGATALLGRLNQRRWMTYGTFALAHPRNDRRERFPPTFRANAVAAHGRSVASPRGRRAS